MQGTYYETDRVASLILMLLYFAIFYGMMLWLEKDAKKKGRTVQCIACENRGGKYPPKNCPNFNCKFVARNGR